MVTLSGTGFFLDTNAEVCLVFNLCVSAVCESTEICKFTMPLPPSSTLDVILNFPGHSIRSNSLPVTVLAPQSIVLVPSISFSHGGDTLTVFGKLFSN
jgi:hypothetical protein